MRDFNGGDVASKLKISGMRNRKQCSLITNDDNLIYRSILSQFLTVWRFEWRDSRRGAFRERHTVKKEKNIFLIYKEIQKISGAKSYTRKGFLIYEEMRKYLVIYEEAVSHCTRSLLFFNSAQNTEHFQYASNCGGLRLACKSCINL